MYKLSTLNVNDIHDLVSQGYIHSLVSCLKQSELFNFETKQTFKSEYM